MKRHSALAAAAVLLALAGCEITDYTTAEAPNKLTLSDASHSFTVRFAPNSAQLARGEAERLDRMIAAGDIGNRDRVTVAAAGPPGLSKRRGETIAAAMLQRGLTIEEATFADLPRDSAVIEIGRYLVTLPPCPNWGKPPSADFTNMRMSNFGCATASNLGEMMANPADLAGGRALGPASGRTAANAVNRYDNDKVILPAANAALPIAAAQNQTPQGGNNNP